MKQEKKIWYELEVRGFYNVDKYDIICMAGGSVLNDLIAQGEYALNLPDEEYETKTMIIRIENTNEVVYLKNN